MEGFEARAVQEGRTRGSGEELVSLWERVAELEQRKRDREVAAAEADGGPITAARMRKVLGQDPVLDVGPTEQRMRDWLSKDPKGYIGVADDKSRVENGDSELKVENDRLREENEQLKKIAYPEHERDEGSERALALYDRILKDLERQAMEEQAQFVKDGLCAVCGQKPIPRRGQAGELSSSRPKSSVPRAESPCEGR